MTTSRSPETNEGVGSDADRVSGNGNPRAQLLEGLPVTERQLDLAGISTAVLEGGEGPPLLLLHGPGEHAPKWLRVIPRLVSTHRVVAPDLPGHGASGSTEGPLDADRVLAWLGELIDRTCPSPPVIVGQIVGGSIAARFAVDHGERIDRLVLVDALGLAAFRPTPEFGGALTRFMSGPDGASHDHLWRHCAFDLDALRSRLGERWEALRAYNLDRAGAPGVLSSVQSLMEQFGLTPIPAAALERIPVPTTLIWGRHDLATALEVAEAASTRYGWPLHVIDDAADDPPLEQPEAFLEVLSLVLAEGSGDAVDPKPGAPTSRPEGTNEIRAGGDGIAEGYDGGETVIRRRSSRVVGKREDRQLDGRMKHLSVLAGLLLSASLSFVALDAQERAPIIDMHLHAHHIPLEVTAGAPPPCAPSPCEVEGTATGTPAESLQKTLEAIDRHNIVLGFLSSADLGLVQDWVAAAPDRFVASPFIEKPGELSPQMLRREYAAGRLAGMGEIGSQLWGVAPNDPALAPYFALAAEFDVPVLIHTAGLGPPSPGFRTAAGNPLLLEEVLVRHPNLRVFVENSGYPFLDEMIAMMYHYPRLYGDLSTISWIIPRTTFHRYLEALVRAGLGKRLMFGSDQMRWPEKIGEAIEAIEEADYLTEGQKRDILYNNAARFLRLDGGSE